MAEFCKECFKRKIATPSDGITDDMLVMSVAYDICEGCGEWKPVVIRAKCIEEELQEYIYDLCETKNTSIDLRFQCYGDVNRFCANNEIFTVECVEYYTSDVKDMKRLMHTIITGLWDYATHSNQRIALYIQDIVYMGGWFDVIVGSCLFEDICLGYNTK
jgi:hypothetical protein